MKEDHILFMEEAIRLARTNMEARNGGPFGAVVVRNGEIIASGTNEVLKHNDPTAHAEIVAIREACEILGTYQLDDCIVYSSCEPCPMCLGALYWSRPKKIFFAASREDAALAGFDDKHIYDELQLDIESRTIPTEQIMHDDAIEVFRQWIQLDLDIVY